LNRDPRLDFEEIFKRLDLDGVEYPLIAVNNGSDYSYIVLANYNYGDYYLELAVGSTYTKLYSKNEGGWKLTETEI